MSKTRKTPPHLNFYHLSPTCNRLVTFPLPSWLSGAMDTTAPSNAVVSNDTAPKTPTTTIQSQQHGPSNGSHSAKNKVVAPNIPYDFSENKATMASHAELPPKAVFPPELLRMITKHFGERKSQADLADLWMNVHNFCKIFKEEVEEIFRKEHLQKTWLHLGNGMLPCSYWLHDDSSSRSSLTKFIA